MLRYIATAILFTLISAVSGDGVIHEGHVSLSMNATSVYLGAQNSSMTWELLVPRDSRYYEIKDLFCYQQSYIMVPTYNDNRPYRNQSFSDNQTYIDPTKLNTMNCSTVVAPKTQLKNPINMTANRNKELPGPCTIRDHIGWIINVANIYKQPSVDSFVSDGKLRWACCGDNCPLEGIGCDPGDCW